MDSAAVIVPDAKGRVLLLLRGATAPRGPLQWNLPGGFLQPGEDVATAARREAFEEANLQIGTLLPVARARSGGGILHVFRALDWSGDVQLLDGEHVAHAWVPWREAPRWDVVQIQRTILGGYATLDGRLTKRASI